MDEFCDFVINVTKIKCNEKGSCVDLLSHDCQVSLG